MPSFFKLKDFQLFDCLNQQPINKFINMVRGSRGPSSSIFMDVQSWPIRSENDPKWPIIGTRPHAKFPPSVGLWDRGVSALWRNLIYERSLRRFLASLNDWIYFSFFRPLFTTIQPIFDRGMAMKIQKFSRSNLLVKLNLVDNTVQLFFFFLLSGLGLDHSKLPKKRTDMQNQLNPCPVLDQSWVLLRPILGV